MDSTILIAYSFLAALTEKQRDIYNMVFVPLCKRVLSTIAQTKKQGSVDDVRYILKRDYGLDVPTSIVRELLIRVSKSQSRKERNNFQLNLVDKANYFTFADFDCGEIETIYAEERRCANALEEAYQAYALAEGYIGSPAFQDFLNQNKQKLSAFFSGDVDSLDDKRIDENFLPHAKFLRKIEGANHQLYKAAERAYLGTLIAAYLEAGVNLDAKLDKGVIYYIDTQVVLEALDLQAPEATRPARDLLDLITTTGGTAKVLSITIDEISGILDREISVYNKQHPTTTIGDALVRLEKKKAWLISLKNSLEDELQNGIGISVETLTDAKLKEYSESTDVEALIATGYGRANAIHDVSAYLTVRERRTVPTRIKPSKAKYWFVSANSKLSFFNQKHCRTTPEIVMPNELTSLLFLKDPVKYSGVVSKKGLSALIAITLTQEYADKDLINEFDSVVKQTDLKLTDDDYELLLEHVAMESTSRLRNLIDEAQNMAGFDTKVHQIVEKARNKKAEQAKQNQDNLEERDRLLQDNKNKEMRNTELSGKLAEKEAEIIAAQNEIRNLKEKEKTSKKVIKRWKVFGIGVVVGLIGLGVSLIPGIGNTLKKMFEWIAGLGGVWSFCNFIFNVTRTSK